MLKKIVAMLRALEHHTHQYQLFLAILLAALAITAAFFAMPVPPVDPDHPRLAVYRIPVPGIGIRHTVPILA